MKNLFKSVSQHLGNKLISHVTETNRPEIRDTAKGYFLGIKAI
jgi:hypothetical protein